MHFGKFEEWKERGIGLKFTDGLTPEENAGNFSLKAWYGATRQIPALDDVLNIAKKKS